MVRLTIITGIPQRLTSSNRSWTRTAVAVNSILTDSHPLFFFLSLIPSSFLFFLLSPLFRNLHLLKLCSVLWVRDTWASESTHLSSSSEVNAMPSWPSLPDRKEAGTAVCFPPLKLPLLSVPLNLGAGYPGTGIRNSHWTYITCLIWGLSWQTRE